MLFLAGINADKYRQVIAESTQIPHSRIGAQRARPKIFAVGLLEHGFVADIHFIARNIFE